MPTLIDTRNAFRRLREEGGFSEEQADAIVDLFRDADEEVATRSDIEELDKRLTQRIELSEERLGQKVEGVRSELTRTIVAYVAAVGAVLTVVIPLVI
jgi:type I restriction-modification system DNA methylase subunit